MCAHVHMHVVQRYFLKKECTRTCVSVYVCAYICMSVCMGVHEHLLMRARKPIYIDVGNWVNFVTH